MISDFLCVCQLPSRFTTQCHASTCHVVCGYICYMHWDGAYSLQSGSGLRIFALGGFRDSRETGPPSISAQQLKAELQEADSSDRGPWHCAMCKMHCMTSWHHDASDFQIQILASTSCTICSCQESNPRISMNFSTLFLLLKTLSEFSKHWLPLLQLHRPFRSWVLPHSEGTQPSRSKELMETANDLQIIVTRWKYISVHCQCILGVSRRFCSLAWVALTSHEVSKNVKDKIHERKIQLEDETRISEVKVWNGMDTYHNALNNTYHFLPLWQPFCLSDSFWPARALDLMLAASAALRRQNVRPQKVEGRHIASSKCKRKKGRM